MGTYFDKIHSHYINIYVLKFVIVAECIPVLSSMIGVRTHLHLKRKQPPDKPGVGGWRMRAPSRQHQQCCTRGEGLEGTLLNGLEGKLLMGLEDPEGL